MWEFSLQIGTGAEGTPILSVLGKRSYLFTPEGKVEVDWYSALPLFSAPQYWGGENPQLDAVRQDGDLVAWKPLVDVVVHGKAHAPRGKRAKFFDVGVGIGGHSAMLRVFGDRSIDLGSGSLRFTEPEPFESMPLHWGLAYGGADPFSHPDFPLVYPRNPVGRGFLVSPAPEHLHRYKLPNLENPKQILTPDTLLIKKFDRWKSAPVPMAYGWTSRSFADRVANASEGHPFKTPPSPNAAPAFLRLPHLGGGESVALGYMDPDHPLLSFDLPADIPEGRLDLGEGTVTLPSVLQTVEIYPATRQFTLLWRASVHVKDLQKLAELPQLDGWMDSKM